MLIVCQWMSLDQNMILACGFLCSNMEKNKSNSNPKTSIGCPILYSIKSLSEIKEILINICLPLFFIFKNKKNNLKTSKFKFYYIKNTNYSQKSSISLKQNFHPLPLNQILRQNNCLRYKKLSIFIKLPLSLKAPTSPFMGIT